MKLEKEQIQKRLAELTPEQKEQFERIAQPAAVCVAWLIAQTDSNVDDDVIDLLKLAFDSIDTANPPSNEDAAKAALELAHEAADATPTKVDDAIVTFVEGLAEGNIFKQVFAAIKTSIAERRERRKANKAEKQ